MRFIENPIRRISKRVNKGVMDEKAIKEIASTKVIFIRGNIFYFFIFIYIKNSQFRFVEMIYRGSKNLCNS